MTTTQLTKKDKAKEFIKRHKVKISGAAVLVTMAAAWILKESGNRYPFSDADCILDGHYNAQSNQYRVSVKNDAFTDPEAVLDAIQAAIQEYKS